jgi:hypothetical protein
MDTKDVSFLLGGAALTVAGCRRAATAGPEQNVITIDVTRNRHPISPEIYGASYAQTDAPGYRCPIDRFGGNNTSRYNWMANADNKGSDWFFETIPHDNPKPGGFVDDFCTKARTAGAAAMITIPMTGWIAQPAPGRKKAWSFSVSKYGRQEKTDAQFCPDAGNGKRPDGKAITGNTPADANIAATPDTFKPWVQKLATTFPNIKYLLLDNEPGLWHETHRDIIPTGVSIDDLWQRSLATSKMCKSAAPKAQVCGPEEWGWTGFQYSPRDAQHGKENGWNNPFKPMPDRKQHGNVDPMTYLLKKFAAEEKASGKRLLDVFTLHFYPQGGEFSGDTSPSMVKRRARSTRALWDPAYKDETWISDTVRLIPRMHEWVKNNYPGTRIGITEYSWGGDEHSSGATSQADILGIFGRERLDIGCRWTSPKAGSPAYNAMAMYTNADGQGHGFGDISVHCAVAEPDLLSAFAAIESKSKLLTIMVINKEAGSRTITLALNGHSAGKAAVYTLGADNNLVAQQGVDVSGRITVPGPSVVLMRIPAKA